MRRRPLIRAATVADASVIARHSEGVAQAEGRDIAVDPGIIAEAIQEGHARYFVAETDDGIVGSLFVTKEWSDWTGAWYWWLQGVFVEETARGQGVFRALFAAVRKAASDAAVSRLRLYVQDDNRKARAAYKALGMRRQPYLVYDAPVETVK